MFKYVILAFALFAAVFAAPAAEPEPQVVLTPSAYTYSSYVAGAPLAYAAPYYSGYSAYAYPSYSVVV